MRHKTKLHIIAISAIVVVMTLLYAIIGPKKAPVDDGMAKGDRYIQIYQATWGMNCNPSITVAKQQQQSTALDPKAPRLELVQPNNVLPALSARCDGRLQCSVPVTSDAFGVDPMNACYKKFTGTYRCFELDRLWNMDGDQGTMLTIDCSPEADKDRK